MVQKMEVVYEDEQLLVCYKPAGLATQTSSIVQQDMVSQVKYYRTQKGEPPYVGVIHRLDQPVEGLLLFAKTESAAAGLSKQLQRRQMSKHYLAVITRNAFPDRGTLEDYLLKDAQAGRARVVKQQDPRAKLARLSYRTLEDTGREKLLDIALETGRFHQIRAQLASRTAPILGDAKYGGTATGRPLALCAYRLKMKSLSDGTDQEFVIKPRGEDFAEFDFVRKLKATPFDTPLSVRTLGRLAVVGE